MLPKVFFSKKGLETFGVNEYILKGYEDKKHIKSSDNTHYLIKLNVYLLTIQG